MGYTPRTTRSRRAVATVAIGGTLAALITGCSSGGTKATGTGNATGSLTATTPAAKGPLDKVTWNLSGGEPASLDYSITWDTSSGNMVLANLCDSLMRQNPDGTYSPAIASKVSTPNDKTYVYDIRSGVKFSDGKPVTAADVAFSLNRQLDPKTGSYWGLWFQNVTSIKATSASQVTVTLKQPDVLFGEMMATSAGAVVEKAYVQAKGKKYGTPGGGVMCAGPYSLKEWSPGKSITLSAVPSYWDSALQPKVKEITFTFLRDPATITNGLRTGSIDGTWTAPLSGIEQLRRASSGKLYENVSATNSLMSMLSFKGALKDVRIRQALQKSIDYAGITHALLHDAAEPAASVANSAYWGYEKDTFKKGYDALPPAKQDLAAAKALVKEAGAPTTPIVIGYDAGDTTAAAVLQSVQDSAKKVGLAVDLKPLPAARWSVVWYDPAARKGLDAAFSTSSGDVPDPAEIFIQFVPSSPLNYTGFKNPAFGDPIIKAAGTMDPAERAKLIVGGQASSAEQVHPFLPLYTMHVLLFLNKRVTGVPVNTLSSLYYPWAATLGAP